jgi:hypothetical protein
MERRCYFLIRSHLAYHYRFVAKRDELMGAYYASAKAAWIFLPKLVAIDHLVNRFGKVSGVLAESKRTEGHWPSIENPPRIFSGAGANIDAAQCRADLV